jgi:hypothetical protein
MIKKAPGRAGTCFCASLDCTNTGDINHRVGCSRQSYKEGTGSGERDKTIGALKVTAVGVPTSGWCVLSVPLKWRGSLLFLLHLKGNGTKKRRGQVGENYWEMPWGRNAQKKGTLRKSLRSAISMVPITAIQKTPNPVLALECLLFLV